MIPENENAAVVALIAVWAVVVVVLAAWSLSVDSPDNDDLRRELERAQTTSELCR